MTTAIKRYNLSIPRCIDYAAKRSLINDPLYDSNIVLKLIIPMYLEEQRKYWCNLEQFNIHSRRLESTKWHVNSRYHPNNHISWFNFTVKERIRILEDVLVFHLHNYDL